MPRTPLSDEEIKRFRARMCEVATEQFAEHGFQRVTMRALANQMGCSPMTPYRYFENKEAIFVAARNCAFLQFQDVLRKASVSEADPLERIAAIARAYAVFAMSSPGSYTIMFLLDQRNFTDFPMADQAGVECWQIMQDAVSSTVDAGAADGDTLTIAHALWVVAHGAVSLHLAGKLVLGRGVEELMDKVVRATMRGFLSESTATA